MVSAKKHVPIVKKRMSTTPLRDATNPSEYPGLWPFNIPDRELPKEDNMLTRFFSVCRHQGVHPSPE